MRALMIAFSMYSRIPMPDFAWREEDRKYAMCFFPLVGAVIGALEYLTYLVLSGAVTGKPFCGRALLAAVLSALPLLLTGGIHMDGYLDTCDARASCGDREKKLAILKDTHVGAFAVIRGGLYLLLYFAACMDHDGVTAAVVGIGFILSRSLSGFAAAVFPEARKHGMLADFMRDAHKKLIASVMVCFGVLSSAAMIYIGEACGAAAVAAAGLAFFYYRRMALREFGGVTGDLAGYFLQLSELSMILAAVIFRRIFL